MEPNTEYNRELELPSFGGKKWRGLRKNTFRDSFFGMLWALQILSLISIRIVIKVHSIQRISGFYRFKPKKGLLLVVIYCGSDDVTFWMKTKLKPLSSIVIARYCCFRITSRLLSPSFLLFSPKCQNVTSSHPQFTNCFYPLDLSFNHQGVLHIAVYIHTFIPGSLRLHTTRETYRLDEVEFGLDELPLEDTRRWLQKNEEPYPGYCRAPASDVCIPALCNCAKLTEINLRLKAKQRKVLVKKLEKIKAVHKFSQNEIPSSSE